MAMCWVSTDIRSPRKPQAGPEQGNGQEGMYRSSVGTSPTLEACGVLLDCSHI